MAKRRIIDASIQFISLCPKGKNKLPVLYKEDSNSVEFNTISKASDDFDDTGELLSLVWIPEYECKDGDVADRDTVKKMCHSFARNGMQLDVRHNEQKLTKEQAYVAQSFVVQKGDPRFKGWKDYQGNEVDATGGWATIMQIDDPKYRQMYRSGEWNGVSLSGPAKFEQLAAEDDSELSPEEKLVQRTLRRLEKMTRKTETGDLDMDKKELQDVLNESNKTLATTVAAAVAEALKPQTKKEDDAKGGKDDGAPVFKGDFTDTDALKKHQEALEEHALRKGVDFNDPAQVKQYMTKLNEHRAAKKEDKSDDKNKGKSAREIQLEKELEAERKKGKSASNQGVGDKKDENDSSIEGMNKEDNDLWKKGSNIAERMNARRGYSKQA